MGLVLAPPDPDQVEITLIGPGYGESCVIHIGDGNWLIVDSCVDSHSQPCAIGYLKSIGVRPEEAVRLIIATHWHDDHIRGLARTVEICTRATFCCSDALSKREFLATVTPYEQRVNFSGGSGVSEIIAVLEILHKYNRSPIVRAGADRRILHRPGNKLSHGLSCEVWTLSPSDEQFKRFLLEIASLVPNIGQTKRRFPVPKQNHLSVVGLIQVGPIGVLLGADLENDHDPNCGWSAIVNSLGRPNTLSQIFKIPHHGSYNGHSDDVWKKMLIQKPITIATPYRRGRKPLPSETDAQRIKELSSQFYLTRENSKATTVKRTSIVEKMIKLAGSINNISEIPGLIRLRNGGTSNPLTWISELSTEAIVIA